MRLVYVFTTMFLLAFPAASAVILQYHHVSKNTPPVTSIDPETFKQHLDYLASEDFEIVALQRIISKVKAREPIPANWIAITFDDGYDNVLTHAHPELVKRNWPYTIFVNPRLIDQKVRGYLSWQQLRDMAKHQVEIASHTMDHVHMIRRLDKETESQWKARLKQDLLETEIRIEAETGQRHNTLAYPYGEFDESIKALLKELNIVGIGQHSGAVSQHSDLYRLPRFPANGIYANLNTLKTKLRTLGFNISEVSPDQILNPQNNPPLLSMTVDSNDFHNQLLRCYAGSEVLEPEWQDANTFTVKASSPVGVGRSRYNCTVPSINTPGYYYWFSQPWIRANDDGSWYPES